MGDGLAVAEAPVVGDRLERVPDGVPEVEDAAQPALALVLGDHVGLDAARLDDGRHQHGRLPRQHGLRLARQQVEEVAAGDHPVLHDLVQSRAKLAPRQGGQRQRVGHHEHRLVERADQVLAERMVDADLAADRAVYLRQQRRRHVHQGDAAQEAGRGKAGGVADDAATDGNHGAAAVGAALDERVVDARHRGQRLVALAVGDEDRLTGDRGLDACALVTPDDWARHDKALASHAVAVEERRELLAETFADQDGGLLIRGGDVDLRGGEDWVCHRFGRALVAPPPTRTAMRLVVRQGRVVIDRIAP